MIIRGWFWILVGVSFFVLCPYTLMLTAALAIEMDTMAIYKIGSVFAWFFLAEASLSVLSLLSPTIERFNIWHWQRLFFLNDS